MKKQKQAASERGITTVQTSGATELYLIRHAPVIGDGLVYGRRDLPADCSNDARFESLRSSLPDMDMVLSSPAKRCLQTARMIWPQVDPHIDAGLWEQDFGDWEGIPFADIPNHGQLDGADLARFAPPNGESFDDVCVRTGLALTSLPVGRVAVVAHAGVIRAALARALGRIPTALRFEIANLSLTSILVLPDRQYVVREVNRCC
jgi:alpha-ribazole phosphatase